MRIGKYCKHRKQCSKKESMEILKKVGIKELPCNVCENYKDVRKEK